MSLVDDFIKDENIFFNEKQFAKKVMIKSLKGSPIESSAIFEENNSNLIMNEGLETNKSDSIIAIKRSVFDIIAITDSTLNGCVITRLSDSKVFDVISILEKDEISVTLICQRNLFSKAKPQ